MKEKGDRRTEGCVEIRGKQHVRTLLRPRTAALRCLGNTSHLGWYSGSHACFWRLYRQRRLGKLSGFESQHGQSRFGSGIAFEIGPAMPLEIVELADAAQFQILPGRPADDHGMLLATLLEEALALRKVIKGNRGRGDERRDP